MADSTEYSVKHRRSKTAVLHFHVEASITIQRKDMAKVMLGRLISI